MTRQPPASPDHQNADPTEPTVRHGEHVDPREKPDQLGVDQRKAETRQEALVDESIEETFPASDPPTAKNIT